MAGLKRYEVMVRKNSTATLDYLFTKYKNLMNYFQNKDSNIDSNGNYIFIYYADIFDMRNGKNYKVFCDYAVNLFNIADYYVTSYGVKIVGVMDANPYLSQTGSVEQKNGVIA